jgi:DNA polymerase-1
MDRLFIVDASGYIYRSYFAIRQMTNSKGESTNALFGFIRSILKLMKDFQPTHLVSVFDGPRNAHKRTAIYPDYKAHRLEMPKDLLHQIHWARDFCQLMGIPELNVPEVEADDTMGSVALWAAKEGATVYLCTGDKDMCQLVNDKILMLNTYKDNQIMGSLEVEKQFGVPPQLMIDFLALTGDASDNVPGLPGFGPKTAAELLQKFGSLDYILDHPDEVPGSKKQETIKQNRDKALISKQLVTIDTAVPFPQEIDFFKTSSPSINGLKEFYTSHDFSTLLRELDTFTPAEVKEKEEEIVEYILVNDENSLRELTDLLCQQTEICLDVETTDLQPLRASIVGIGLGIEPKKAWYIPLNGQIPAETVLNYLKPILENPAIGFYGHNFKYDYQVLANYGIDVAHISFDTILASYLLNSHSRQHSLDYLALNLFEKVKIPIQNLIGKGKKQACMSTVPLDQICLYCCEDVDYTMRLKHLLAPQMKERTLTSLLQDLELPLLRILAKMERHGIYIDVPFLQHLSIEIKEEIKKLEEEIYILAGEPFNLNSPKQLSQILFEKLGIKPPKKTATGHSTNADVLESLKEEYPIAHKLLEYRGLEKLRSTYVDALPSEVNPSTQRIHCNFNQSVAATGRLASQDPNLQNIPVRTEIGRKIREAFKPQLEGWSYLAADYSQIELRLLAHLSDDPALIEAFQTNGDIHTFTASLIFSIPPEEVTREQRYQAKAVNFGIIYGQQAYGLSQELKIDTKTAGAFIHMYFHRYQKVKQFIDACKERTRQTGKAVTVLGRERLIPEINSPNGMIRSAAERLAINMPIQGSQADIIKLAMLEIDRQLKQKNKKSYMILQIHDELIFEVPNEEVEEMKSLVKEAMENIIKLKVPLIVDIHIGKNWKEC